MKMGTFAAFKGWSTVHVHNDCTVSILWLMLHVQMVMWLQIILSVYMDNRLTNTYYNANFG